METLTEPLVKCVKCNHLNAAESDHCSQCEAHLYLVCRYCSTKNRRDEKTCSKCGSELQREKRRHKRQKTAINGHKVKIAVLSCILVAAVVSAILWFIFAYNKLG
jgi:predicted nucleic acid-binding Zn ribbon protein